MSTNVKVDLTHEPSLSSPLTHSFSLISSSSAILFLLRKPNNPVPPQNPNPKTQFPSSLPLSTPSIHLLLRSSILIILAIITYAIVASIYLFLRRHHRPHLIHHLSSSSSSSLSPSSPPSPSSDDNQDPPPTSSSTSPSNAPTTLAPPPMMSPSTLLLPPSISTATPPPSAAPATSLPSSPIAGPHPHVIILSQPFHSYVSVLQLLYSSNFSSVDAILSVSDALDLLPIASRLLFDDLISFLLSFIKALPWSPDDKDCILLLARISRPPRQNLAA